MNVSRRRGLPAAASIVEERAFSPNRIAVRGLAAPRVARTYRILRTTEVDPSDAPMARAAIPPIGTAALAPPGDAFRGKARKKAKLSVADADIEPFDDLTDLIDDLPADSAMASHDPPISTAQNSGRVEEEKRNVQVGAFLYAASREDDNDFHIIIGRDPGAAESVYMNVELSGLPPKSSKHHATLRGARDAFKAFFADDLPGMSYDFYDPPIPVEIQGSVFFDVNHASGSKPGPASLRDDIPTIWEIHPISRIVFEP
jgi:hypothetical protein